MAFITLFVKLVGIKQLSHGYIFRPFIMLAFVKINDEKAVEL